MEFRVLSGTGDDGRHWSDLVRGLPEPLRDLHYLPGYGLIYRETYDHEPLLACGSEGDAYVILPFVRRRLNSLPFLAEQAVTEPYWDIANAYGYGGPVCSSPAGAGTPGLLAGFDRAFRAWCIEQRIAAEFCSLHPLLGNHTLVSSWPGVEPRLEKRVVYIDLLQSEEALWRAVNRGHRSSIQRARQAGVRVERVPADAAHLAEFQRLYLKTMERHRAENRWYFPPDYFANCARFLGDGSVALFFARVDRAVASAYLLLHHGGIAYYHFGGSDDSFFHLRPNNLLLYETALWAKHAGNRIYHLGGGVTADEADNLLRFKAGFGGASAPLYVYGRVHDRATYERLCELKTSHERGAAGGIPDGEYFPLYRRRVSR